MGRDSRTPSCEMPSPQAGGGLERAGWTVDERRVAPVRPKCLQRLPGRGRDSDDPCFARAFEESFSDGEHRVTTRDHGAVGAGSREHPHPLAIHDAVRQRRDPSHRTRRIDDADDDTFPHAGGADQRPFLEPTTEHGKRHDGGFEPGDVEQSLDRRAERPRDTHRCVRRRHVAPAFQRSDEGSADAGPGRQLTLCQACCDTYVTDPSPDVLKFLDARILRE
jgi:hypothetical protein